MHNIQIVVEENAAEEGFDPDPDQLRHIAQYVLTASDCHEANISVAVVNDDTIRNLKREFFGIDISTDVISFDLSEPTVSSSLECEVVVNAPLAARQAHQSGNQPMAELALYLTHGLLHQLGYDDQSLDDATLMHQREDELLTELGFGAVYRGGTGE